MTLVTRFDSIVVRDEEMEGKKERRREKQVLGKEGIFGSGQVTGHAASRCCRERRGVGQKTAA
jgi:hypothetical protein